MSASMVMIAIVKMFWWAVEKGKDGSIVVISNLQLKAQPGQKVMVQEFLVIDDD